MHARVSFSDVGSRHTSDDVIVYAYINPVVARTCGPS